MAVTKPSYRDAILTDRRLRRKDDTGDDNDYYTDQVDPGAIYATVGGVADNGNLTVTITPADTVKYPTPDAVVFTRTTETLNESAEGLYDAIVADLAIDTTTMQAANRHLPKYIMRAEYTAATAIVRIVPNPFAPPFTVTMTGTGGTMTLTFTPDDTFPITGYSAKHVGANVDTPPTHVILTVHAVTTANEILGIGTCTFDLQGLRVIDRHDPITGTTWRPGVEDEGSLTGLTLGEPVEMPLGGGRFGVRITNIANAPATTDALEVRWREVSR